MPRIFSTVLVTLFVLSWNAEGGTGSKHSFRKVKESIHLAPFESAILKKQDVQWPLVYPEQFKIACRLGVQKVKNGSFAPSFGAAFEMIWEQTLFYGAAYEMGIVPAQDSIPGGKTHRFGLNTGIIFQLDEYEKHHLLALIRPGLSMVKTEGGSASRFGLGLGIGYEYSLNSDYILCPEIVYHKFPGGTATMPGFSSWSFALRLSFGK
ncbi:MAG TPA: hypothetical protein PK509_17490 [Catalimonadaceae bacterium]|nr:hypothetical protein [Catalimonadaceae bacterium]